MTRLAIVLELALVYVDARLGQLVPPEAELALADEASRRVDALLVARACLRILLALVDVDAATVPHVLGAGLAMLAGTGRLGDRRRTRFRLHRNRSSGATVTAGLVVADLVATRMRPLGAFVDIWVSKGKQLLNEEPDEALRAPAVRAHAA